MAGDAAPAPVRRSSRAAKPSIKVDNDTLYPRDIPLPIHPTEHPIDASNYGYRWLKRQKQLNKEWFKHLDFINVGLDIIKKLFWTDNLANTHNVYIDPPRALRRDPKTIKQFMEKGTNQKRGIVKTYSKYEDSEELDMLYPDVDSTASESEDSSIDYGSDWEMYEPIYVDNEIKTYQCPGLTMEGIRNSSRLTDERKADLSYGFKHVVREGMVAKAKLLHPDNFLWDDEAYHGAHGALTTGVKSRVDWLVYEKPPVDDEYNFATIRDVNCTQSSLKEGMPCANCQKSRQHLLRRITQTADIRRKPLHKYTTNAALQRTPSVINEKAVALANQLKTLQQSYRAKLFKKMSHDEGVAVEVNESSDYIFNDDVTNNMENFLAEEVSKDSLAYYVFTESVRKHKIAKETGKRSVRHCPIAIRLGALIRGKMGYSGGLYDLVASALGLPTDRTLQEYTIPTTNDPDGILVKNIMREMQIFNDRNPNAGLFDWERHVTLAFDSMSCKGRFVVNFHTNEIVGMATDCLKPNVILNELTELQKSDMTGEQIQEAGEDANKDPPVPDVAKHFLIFAATTWSPNAQDGRRSKHQFVCARYCLKTIDSEFLIPTIRKIILHLSYCGFLVDTIVGDGASENRSTFKILATISARDILTEHYGDALMEAMPSDFKIAFYHPNPVYKDHIKIFIGGEMPHWVKKFRNAMDSKNKILCWQGCEFSLKLFEDMWKLMNDSGVAGRNDVRVYKFGNEHFNLNSYNKMRVFLAVQIPSQTMIRLIKDCCEAHPDDYDLEAYEPVIEIFDKVDRLVDIINATRRDLKVEYIDGPQHKHIFELFSVLQLFQLWREDAENFEFITRESYEDLQWMVFGMAGVACTYLDGDKSKKMHQGRSGSDVCEHFFAKIRQVNTNPNPQQCREITSKICGQGIGANHLFNFKSGSNTAGIKRDHDAYLAPVHKRQKGKTKQKESLIG